ncbi:phage tail assembly protein [Desulfocurvus sp. DL9XJH121]
MNAETITLEYPVRHQGHEYGQITMRRPRVGDMLAADKQGGSDMERELAMFASLCEVAPDVLRELDMKDYRKLQVAYTGFLS